MNNDIANIASKVIPTKRPPPAPRKGSKHLQKVQINEENDDLFNDDPNAKNAEQLLSKLMPFEGIKILRERVYPEPFNFKLEDIINLNNGQLFTDLTSVLTPNFLSLVSLETLDKLNENEKKWQKPSHKNLARKRGLEKIVSYTHKKHIEMLNLDKIRQSFQLKTIKKALSRASFINFSIKDKQKNMHLSQQALFLQIFYYYHMKHDMRFKAKIDSLGIEMDNPYARQQIRNENRKDDFLGKKYLEDMEVDEWCKHLLEIFFPTTSGIWADHIHVTHVYILKILMFCYECGFMDLDDSETILNLLNKACSSLSKLEEAWKEKLTEINKLSDNFKAYNVVRHFAQCRETISCILVQILTLYQDEYFLDAFPKYCKDKVSENDEEKLKEMMEDLKKDHYPLMNENQNNIILSITMNYLSNQVKIDIHKSTTPQTLKAVEKIFLYITTDKKDSFLESIKQVTVSDLRYFSSEDPISGRIRDKCDQLGYSMRTLLKLIGRGYFDKKTMVMIKEDLNDDEYKEYLHEPYVSKMSKSAYLQPGRGIDLAGTSSENFNKISNASNYITLLDLINAIFKDIETDMQGDEKFDFKVALVKESIPLMSLALADYVDEYFVVNKDWRTFMTHTFDLLFEICTGNNSAKGQIFKGDGLFHFNGLINRKNKYSFFLLNKLCNTDENIAIFLGRGLFSDIIRVFSEFQDEVLRDIDEIDKEMPDPGNPSAMQKNLPEKLGVDDWSLYIILNNLFSKLMTRTFIDETSKLQTSLQIQEAIFPSLSETLMEKFTKMLGDDSGKHQPEEKMLKKEIFMSGNEDEMVKILDKREDENDISYYDVRVIIMQVCYSSIKAFNMACSDVFSANVQESMLDYVVDLRAYLINSSLSTKLPIDPFGVDAEILKMLKNLTLIPEANLLIERDFNLFSEENEVFDKGDPAAENIAKFLDRCREYAKTPGLYQEGTKLLMEGVFPYAYKYVTTLLNLTNYEVYSQYKDVEINGVKTGMRTKEVINNLKDNLIITNKVFNHYYTFCKDTEVTQNLMPRIGSLTLLSGATETYEFELEYKHSNTTSNTNESRKKKKRKKHQKLEEMTNELIKKCQKMMSDIEKFYEQSEYTGELAQFKQMTEEEYEEATEKATFTAKIESEDIKIKNDVLNFLIKGFLETKEEYLEGNESPNLINFFDKNTDNLKGVFESCIARIFDIPRHVKFNKDHKLSLTKDTGINRFWMDQSCYAYIKMLDKLLSSSKTARTELYTFLMEAEDEEEEVDGETNFEKGKNDFRDQSLRSVQIKSGVGSVDQYARKKMPPKGTGRYKNIGKEDNKGDRKRLLGMLMRIEHDLLLYLSTNPSQKAMWWNVLQIYDMVCSFFKNLCENNYLPFKEYLGACVPKVMDNTWNVEGMTCMEIFSNQMIYLLNSTKLADNRDSVMIHTDQADRIQPLLLPLITTINELVTGPCEINQQTLVSKDLVKLFKVMTRVMNDIGEDFMELKHMCLTLIISMTEGFNPVIIKKIALRVTPSIILNQIQRLSKKIYINQLISSRTYTNELLHAEEERKREKMLRQQKKLTKNRVMSKLPQGNVTEPSSTGGGSSYSELSSNNKSANDIKIMDGNSFIKAVDQMEASPASQNKIVPLSRKKSSKGLILESMRKQSELIREGKVLEDVYKKNIVTQEMENSLYIRHWVILEDMYKKVPSFSEGLVFDFVFRIAILWQSLTEFSKRHNVSLKEIRDEANACFEWFSDKKFSAYQREISSIIYFLDKIMLSIEIVDPSENKLLMYFPRRPECYFLTTEDKNNYRKECKITDSNTKMLDLMRNFKLFSIQMESNLKSYRTRPTLHYLGSKDAFALYNFFTYLQGVALSVVMYLGLERRASDSELIHKNDVYRFILMGLFIAQVGFSALFLISWMFLKYKQTRMIQREDFIFDNPGKNPDTLINKFRILIVKSLIKEPTPCNMFFHLIFTGVGWSLDSWILISLNLFLLVNISVVAKSVLKSITLHMDQLIITLILTIFAIFSYSIDIARNYTQTLDNDLDLCSDLYGCFMFTLNWGLRNGGGIADSMKVQDRDGLFFRKTFWDISFFMIVNVTALNIIFGIIIDTFSDLRDKEQERSKNHQNPIF